ncbi:MAG: glycosyltransferase [Candidatus Methylomirabilia bacterium]
MDPGLTIMLLITAAGIVLPLGLNIVFFLIVSLSPGKSGARRAPPAGPPPAASMIIVVRDGAELIGAKIANTLALDYPAENLEIVIYSDASTDGTDRAVAPYLSERVHFVSTPVHQGKIKGMNAAASRATGEILVFSDADALLDQDALLHLVRHFSDPAIGGVCGNRIITESAHRLTQAQSCYISFDHAIKTLESGKGSISSNDGKLFAVRKNLYREIPDGVTDDLYACLAVVRQKYRFVYESEARARIRIPSRSIAHEVVRRRRIVSTSLRGIWMMRELLNPFSYGMFAVGLAVNKVLRRLLPVLLVVFFLGTAVSAAAHRGSALLFAAQCLFYLFGLLYVLIFRHLPEIPLVTKPCSVVFYFCLGNYGALRGVVDFILGREVVKWTPVKNDPS